MAESYVETLAESSVDLTDKGSPGILLLLMPVLQVESFSLALRHSPVAFIHSQNLSQPLWPKAFLAPLLQTSGGLLLIFRQRPVGDLTPI